MSWSFVLTDLYGGVYGELTGASARKVTLPHLRIPSATCTLPVWHPQAQTAMDNDCLLKCYRTDLFTGQKDLAFIGPVVSAEENGDGGSQTVAITAAGPYWRVQKRIIPGSKLQNGVNYGVAGSPLDLGTIARNILIDVNGPHFTGIDMGTQVSTTTGWVGTYFLKNAAEAIAEISAGLNTFEFRVRPVEPYAYANPESWPAIGLFDVAPTLGSSQPDVVFEYGTTRANIASYNRAVSRDGLLTDAIVTVAGWPDGVVKDVNGNDLYGLVERSDGTAIASRGFFEEVIPDNGMLDAGIRTSVADYSILIRKQPRQTITFTLAPNARPAPFVSYNVGDTVRARAIVNSSLRFDALFRIWGITFDVDENGNENVDLELVTP